MDSNFSIQMEKPLLLKDYLLEDLSSCSSNGFRSFSRKQCCYAVGFFAEFKKPRNHSAINAIFRSFPFSFTLPTTRTKNRRRSASILRSLSKKLIKSSSFCKSKPEEKEIGWWKSAGQSAAEVFQPSDFSGNSLATIGSKRDIWSDSDLNATDSSSAESSSEVLNVSDDGKQEPNQELISEVDFSYPSNVDVLTEPVTKSSNTKEQWDKDEDFSFSHRLLARIQGAKKRLMHRIKRFKHLAKIKPISRSSNQSDSHNVISDFKDDNKTKSKAFEPKAKSSQSRKEMMLLEPEMNKKTQEAYAIELRNESRCDNEEQCVVTEELENQIFISLVNEFVEEVIL